MLKAKPDCCEEATKIIRPRVDGGEPDLRMCDMCADHSVRNRNMILLGPYEKQKIMKADYTRWRQRLAGQKVVTYTEPDEADVGFYRLPIKERKQNAAGQNNGQWKTIGFKPVALFVAPTEPDGTITLQCQIGAQVVDDDRRNDAWTSFVRHPITEEAWRAAAERGEGWSDFTPPAAIIRTADEMAEIRAAKEGKTVATPPAEITFDDVVDAYTAVDKAITAEDEKRAAVPPQDAIKQRLAALKAEAPKFAKIESDEQSSAARGLQARFLELRGEAAGHYEEANRPLLEQQKALRTIWFPLRDEADEEKTKLGTAMGAWEDFKREAARKAQIEAERKQREHDAAVAAAEAANRPAPPPPPEVKPNAPAPSDQIRAPGARAAKVSLKKIVTAIDVDKAFAQFKAAPEVREVLMALAQRAVTAGLPVDGATIEERSSVR